MDSKEIERRSRDLQKAASTSEAPATLLKLLDELRSGVKASEEILRSTKIGVAVNKLRQHKDSQVASKAAELVSKWRTDIKNGSGGAARKGSPAVNGAASGTATPVTSSGVVSPPASAPTQRKSNVPPEQRNAKTDEVDTAKTGNGTRDNCIKLMYDGLAFMSEDAPSQILPVAVDIEERVHFHYSPETSAPYKSKIRSLFQNLKIKQNIVLRSRVLRGDITPDAFAQMTQDDLKSDERRAEEDKMNKENMNKAMVAQEEKSISASLVCGKCKEKKVSYTQAQTRSADEPMTTFCECTVCGNRWKFS